MYLDQKSYLHLRGILDHMSQDVEKMISRKDAYLRGDFSSDITILLDFFELCRPIDESLLNEIETRLVTHYFDAMRCAELVRHPIFQLLMACRIGHTKIGGIITFPDICKRIGMSRQQLHQQSYNLLDEPPLDQRKNRLPAIKNKGFCFAFIRDFYNWEHTRTRRRIRRTSETAGNGQEGVHYDSDRSDY